MQQPEPLWLGSFHSFIRNSFQSKGAPTYECRHLSTIDALWVEWVGAGLAPETLWVGGTKVWSMDVARGTPLRAV